MEHKYELDQLREEMVRLQQKIHDLQQKNDRMRALYVSLLLRLKIEEEEDHHQADEEYEVVMNSK